MVYDTSFVYNVTIEPDITMTTLWAFWISINFEIQLGKRDLIQNLNCHLQRQMFINSMITLIIVF